MLSGFGADLTSKTFFEKTLSSGTQQEQQLQILAKNLSNVVVERLFKAIYFI